MDIYIKPIFKSEEWVGDIHVGIISREIVKSWDYMSTPGKTENRELGSSIQSSDIAEFS